MEETLKNDEEPLLGFVASVVAPNGRLGSSLSPFALAVSAVDGRSRLLSPNDNLEVLRTIDLRGCGVSSVPEDVPLAWRLGVGGGGSCTEDMSIDGK